MPPKSEFEQIIGALRGRLDALESGIDLDAVLSRLDALEAAVASNHTSIADLVAGLQSLDAEVTEHLMDVSKSFSILSGPVGGTDLVIPPPAPPGATEVFNEDFPANFVWELGGAAPMDGIEFIGSDTKHVTGRVVETEVAGNKLGIELPRVGMPGGDKGRWRGRINPAAGPWDPAATAELTLTFPSDFDPASGGTLFGLQSNGFTGGAKPNGTSDGSLIEVVWGAATSGNDFAGEVRIYHAGAVGGGGYDAVAFSIDLTKGPETTIRITGTNNTGAGVADGSAVVELNDTAVATKTDCTFYTGSEANRAAHRWKGSHHDIKHEGTFHSMSPSSLTSAADWDTEFEAFYFSLSSPFTNANIETLGGASSGFPRSDGELPISFSGGSYFLQAFMSQLWLTDDSKYLDRAGEMIDYWWTKRDTERGVGNWLSGTDRYAKADDWFKTNDSVPFPGWPRNFSGDWAMEPLIVGEAAYPFAYYADFCFENRNVSAAHQTRAADILTWLEEIIDGTGADHEGVNGLFTHNPYGDLSVAGTYRIPRTGIGETGYHRPVPLNQGTGLVACAQIVARARGGNAVYETIVRETIDYLMTGASSDSPFAAWLRVNGDGAYEWDYSPKAHDEGVHGPNRDRIEDQAHAHMVMRMIVQGFHGGFGTITTDDLVSFAKTFNVAMNLSSTTIADHVDGGGGSASNHNTGKIGIDIIDLAEWRPALLDQIVTLFEDDRFSNPGNTTVFAGWANILRWKFSTPNTQPFGSGPSLILHRLRMEVP